MNQSLKEDWEPLGEESRLNHEVLVLFNTIIGVCAGIRAKSQSFEE